ncbi:30S ribosomal protein S5, chloroplastic isoform X1 [Argentina anserina]|uniref:30S ribosomal protein S5, chloroplastic isoform X1 n=1 Tax=Argentina anserina TaxID=57926 RepID=UPI00217674F8|nr:30S ribosomal protein S5, chloroplastic isoform X1 [Potentilla anserina]
MTTASSTLSSLSSLSLHASPRLSLLPFTSANTSSLAKLKSPISLFISSSPRLTSITCNNAELPEVETTFFDNDDPEYEAVFEPPEAPEGFVPPPSFDDESSETEDEIAAAYEELYGPAYSGITVLGNDIHVMDSKVKKLGAFGKLKKEKIRDGFEERVVQVRRVTKVVKGGKQLHFRAIVVVGDKQGNVGVGVGKAKEVVGAVQKSAVNARRNIITVPMTKYLTFPHRSEGDYGAAKVMLRPASPGTGVIAGGSVRIVLEMAGVENALGKQLGSKNALNNARATVVAVQKMRQFREVALDRGIPMEELWK